MDVVIKRKMNIIFPIDPFGSVYDLIRICSNQLITSGVPQLPINVISSVAKQSLHGANICAEW